MEILVQDYLDVTGRFDAVVSVGMLEHVGPRNYDAYADAVERRPAADGVSPLHTTAGRFP